MLNTKVPAELALFTIDTSMDDILTKRSAFNPYPEQAAEGILVSNGMHPTGNPLMWIKYIGTGNVYAAQEPISYPIKEFNAPELEDETAAPVHYREDGTPIGERWITFDQFFKGISLDVVERAMFQLSEFKDAIALAVVSMFDQDNKPIFRKPSEAYLAIVQQSLERIENGQFATAWALVDAGFNVGDYEVNGKNYGDPAWGVFKYHGRDLVAEACPYAFLDYPEAIGRPGLHSVLNDVASEVHAWVVSSIQVRALALALQQYNGVARDHIVRVLESAEQRRTKAISKLSARVSKHADTTTGNYYMQAVGYFLARGITF